MLRTLCDSVVLHASGAEDGLCHHAEPLGEYTARAESRNRLFALAGFALLGVFLSLYIDFESARLAWLVFITLPFALAGGVGAAQLTGACSRSDRSSVSRRCSASPNATASC